MKKEKSNLKASEVNKIVDLFSYKTQKDAKEEQNRKDIIRERCIKKLIAYAETLNW